MKCNEVNSSLDAYADGELSSGQAQQINEHLRSCSDCGEDYRELTDLKSAIISSEIYDSAPLQLKKRISDSLKKSERNTISWPKLPATLGYSLPALLFGLIIGWTTLSHLSALDAEDEFIELLASAHIHSLMADHLTDIASSDSHSVKPWFHGRLDFSPPVHDLTQQGYPLLGGRLEYLEGGSIAALIYQHRQHTINLFVRPKTAQVGKVESAEYNGYHIVHWNYASHSYWAVSDLNLSDLENFKELLSGEIK